MDAMTHVPSLGDDAAYEDMLHKLFAGCTDEELDEFGRLADDAHDEAYGSSMPRSRFSKLSAALARKGARDPDALAAYIGRKKYTRKTFAAMAAGHRSAGSALDALGEERKFHPGQLRDPEGQWSKGGGVGGAIKDALKLGDRIQLGDGETLAGSDVLRADDGSSLPMAWTHSPGGAKLRLGIGIPTDDEKNWRAADKGRTVVLDEAAAHRLAEATRQMREAGAAGEAKSAQLDKRAGELEAKQRELIRSQYPSLTTAQAKELDDLDEEIQDKALQIESLELYTADAHAELPEAAKARSSEIDAEIKRLVAENQQLYAQFWAGGGQDNSLLTQTKRRTIQIEDLFDEKDDLHKQRESGRRLVGYAHLAKQRREKLERARRDLEIAQIDREELTGDPVPLSAADAAELEAIGPELERTYDAHIALVDEPVTGVVPAEWGDVAYTVSISDGDGTARYEMGVRPPDADEDWTLGYGEEAATLTATELAALEHKLTAGPGITEGRSAMSDDLTTRGLAALHGINTGQERQFDASSHPRAPVGSTTGGQFAKAPAQQQPAKAPAKKAAPKKNTDPPGETETSVKPGAGARKPRHVVIPKGSMGYDPAANHGTGYGSKAGDPRVHTLQDALNAAGFGDMRGRKLASDGKLGPLTTSAVRKAQRALGVKADGLVTPELLKRISALKPVHNPKAGHQPAKHKPAAHKPTPRKPAIHHDTHKPAPAVTKAAAMATAHKTAVAAKAAAPPKAAAQPKRRSPVKRVDYYDPVGRSAELRRFDPLQHRDPDGKWGDGMVGHLLASLAKTGAGGAFQSRENPGSYMDWSTRTADGGHQFEIQGDDGEYVHLDLSHEQLADLHTALTEALGGGDDPGIYFPGDAHDEADHRQFDWSDESDVNGDTIRNLNIGGEDADGDEAWTAIEMTDQDMQDWHTALTITLLPQAAAPPVTRSAPPADTWTHQRAAGPSTKALANPRRQTDPSQQRRSAAMSLCTRAFDFEFETRSSDPDGDGRSLAGYAAVFNTSTRIRDLQGDFDETILPGAFRRSIGQRMPVLQFDHGKDPAVGGAPIGKITHLAEDSKGLHVRARLFADASIARVREAIAEQAITGMSFRFGVPQGGDSWSHRNGEVDLREIRDTDVHELGPVVFPAYDATSVSVRSLLAGLNAAEVRELVHELREHFDLAVDLRDDEPATGGIIPAGARTYTVGETSPEPITIGRRGINIPAAPRSTPDPTNLTGRSSARRADGGDTGTTPRSGVPVPTRTPAPATAVAPQSAEESRLFARALHAIGAL